MSEQIKRDRKFEEERAEYIRWLDNSIRRWAKLGIKLDREQAIRNFDENYIRKARATTRKLLVPEHGFEGETQVDQ